MSARLLPIFATMALALSACGDREAAASDPSPTMIKNGTASTTAPGDTSTTAPGKPASPDKPQYGPSSNSPLTDNLAASAVGCRTVDCSIRFNFAGYTSSAGPSHVAVFRTKGEYSGAYDQAYAAVIGINGKVVWKSQTFDFFGEEPVAYADPSGNVLIEAVAGAHSGGVYVIRPTAKGVETFGSFPGTKGEGDMGAFYGDSPSTAEDVDGDGVREITKSVSDYEPNYADGTSTLTTYKWNGSAYAATACKTVQDGKTKSTYKPSNGRC